MKPPPVNILVKYSCRGCGLHRVEASVPARTTEGIQFWVESIMASAISADHTRRSPFCAARVMSDVMIPMDGAQKVGGPSVN